jgi:hypothetical protein
MHSLTSSEVEILDTYLRYNERMNDDDYWAWDRLGEMVRSDRQLGWRLILALIECASAEQLGAVAAGPLEDYVNRHGEQMIDTIALESENNPRFRSCLAGVWLSRGAVSRSTEKRLVEASGNRLQVMGTDAT